MVPHISRMLAFGEENFDKPAKNTSLEIKIDDTETGITGIEDN